MAGKPKLLLIAYRAFGDWLFTVPILPYLFEKYDVYLECSLKVFLLAYDDPRFKQIAVFRFEDKPQADWPDLFAKRWIAQRDLVKPDKEINLNGSMELTCIAERYQPEFHLPVGARRVIFGSNGFYDAIFARIGIPVPNPLVTSVMHFTTEQSTQVEAWRGKHKDEFKVFIGLSGTTMQKRFPNALEVAEKILERYGDAVIYMTGDEACQALVPGHPRVHSLCGDHAAIKQIVHLTKYADFVVCPETFLAVAAGMWGRPKMCLCTTSSVYQICQYQANDFSVQAPIWCSPCHRAIYAPDDCESVIKPEGAEPYALCTRRFSTESILERVEHAYGLWRDIQRGVREPISGTR